MKYLHLLISLIIWIGITNAYSQTAVDISTTAEKINIRETLLVLEDSSNSMTAEDAMLSDEFKKANQSVPNLGISKSSFWVKFQLKNSTSMKSFILELTYPTINIAELYLVDSNKPILIDHMGDEIAFNKRKYKHPSYLFDIEIPSSEGTKTYLMKIKSDEQTLVPISVGSPQSVFESLLNRDIIWGIYFGIIIVMLVYNLFIYIIVRESVYLYYVFYIITVGLTQGSLSGYTYEYLWPNSPWIANQSTIFFPAITGILLIEFLKKFIQTREYAPMLHKGLYVLYVLFAICINAGILGYYNMAQLLIQVSAMIFSLYTLTLAIVISKKGNRSAKFFLIAWSVFLLGICIFILKDFGVFPYNSFTNYTMPLGSAFELAMLSIALADRISILRREKEASQAEALRVSIENEKIIREQNIVLEKTVQERTLELRSTNDDLNVAMKELKDTQSQLVSAEKMASLGQLTAGIAHEINNPINFVTSSVKPLKRNITDILEVLNKYSEINEEGQLKEKLEEIQNLKEEVEMEYVLEEINDIMESIEEGANRTAEIVQGLRNFSHIDDIGIKENDINKGIDSTLKLLVSELTGIKVNKEYSELPKIECFGGKVNQVFLNIINNSIQAVKKSGKEIPSEITLKTTKDDQSVTIEIIDNGTGIEDDIKEKIFDPFFTTKDVGEGTGLGLSVAYGIIEQHHGSIKVESKVGQGTKFIVTLPITQPQTKE